MEHVVFFSETTGEPAFRRLGDLDEAVRLVESLRNERGIVDVTVHSLTPVPVSFRTYYRVEIGAPDADAAPPALADGVGPQDMVADEPAAEAPVEVADEPVALSALSLLAPPQVEPVEYGDVFAPTVEDERVADEQFADEPPLEGGSLLEEQPVEEFDPFVPQARPESEPERSLGYFA